jgi:hypothetical protein
MGLNLSNYYDTRITIDHFGGKQVANSNAVSPDKVSLSADIVAAYVSRNSVTPKRSACFDRVDSLGSHKPWCCGSCSRS